MPIGSGYDWKITARKFLMQFILIAALAGLLWVIESGIPGLMIDYPAYVAILSFISSLIVAFYNFLKHYKDTDDIPD